MKLLSGLAGLSKAKLVAVIAGAAVVVGGASAAAYYGVVVPNQPQNVLKSSTENFLKKDKISGKGSLSFKGKDSPAATVSYTLKADQTKNASEGTADLSVSGTKIPLEFKALEKSAYLKVGDLSNVESLAATAYGPETGALVNSLAAKVENKWIEFDESLLKSATSNNCSLFSDQNRISDEQINQLMEIYEKNTFATIKNESSEEVEGKSATKYELGLDKEKAKTFGKEVQQLDFVKKLKECSGPSASETDTNLDEFKGEASMTVWVDKAKKQIVKIAFSTSNEGDSLNADFIVNDENVDVKKPEGAIPATQLLGEISPFLGAALGASPSPSTSSGTGSDLTQKCVAQAQAAAASGAEISAECQAIFGGTAQ